MRSGSEFSGPVVSVLCVLCEQPSQWRHGYALARETRLTPGKLYPALIRLAGRGLVEACWQDEPRPGRPRRQLYRLTADGLAVAVDMLVAVAEAVAEGLKMSAMGGLGVWGMPCRPRLRAARTHAAAYPATLTAPAVQASAAGPGLARTGARPATAVIASPLDSLGPMSSPSEAR